jgi:hypothetical protein
MSEAKNKRTQFAFNQSLSVKNHHYKSLSTSSIKTTAHKKRSTNRDLWITTLVRYISTSSFSNISNQCYKQFFSQIQANTADLSKTAYSFFCCGF